MLYDLHLLYAPSLAHLENIQNAESSRDIERYIILKRTNLAMDMKNYNIYKDPYSDSTDKYIYQRILQVNLKIVELQITNKELKELKNFLDNLKKYH